MKRYLLFAGDSRYPNGGWDDFVGDYESLELATKKAIKYIENGRDWWHIVDLKTGKKASYNV